MRHPAILKTMHLFFGASLLIASRLTAEETCCKNGPCENKQAETNYGLTGDWSGYRSKLKDRGLELTANYTGEIFGNPTGGKKHGVVFDGLLKLALDINLEKTAGITDATFRVSGLYPHGTSGSLRNVGDVSLFSNLDTFDSYRLVDLWVEQKLSEGKLSLRVGQMRVDDEFGVTDSAALFINSTFGAPNPPSTPMPLGSYPLGALGVRFRFEPVEGFYGLLGIYDGNPSAGDFGGHAKRHGTDWALRSSEGALYAGELGLQRSTGTYPGAIRIGFLHHTMDFQDVRSNSPDTVHNSSTSTYYVIDQTFWRSSKDSKRGASVFVRGTFAERKTATMSTTTQLGAVYTGLLGTEDKLGVALARNTFSPGQTSFGSESLAELSYQIPVTSFMRVQPDVQYIARPGSTNQYQNAWVLGVRAVLDF